MKKKHLLFTSLAALTLAAASQPAFAEEVNATATTTATALAETTDATETAASTMDVTAIANSDYSSVQGEWVNAQGESLEVTADGVAFSGYAFVSHYELTGETESTLKNLSSNAYTEAYDAVLSEEPSSIYVKTKHVNYIPQGGSFEWLKDGSGLGQAVADEDMIVVMPEQEHAVPPLSHVLDYRVYKRATVAKELPATDAAEQPAQSAVTQISGQWVNGDGNPIVISETGEMSFGGIRISPDSFTSQLDEPQDYTSGLYFKSPEGWPAVHGVTYLAETDQLRLVLPVGWASTGDEETDKAIAEDYSKMTLYSRYVADQSEETPAVSQPEADDKTEETVAEQEEETSEDITTTPVSEEITTDVDTHAETRYDLLTKIDKSGLSDTQKSALAEKVAVAETAEELAGIQAEVETLIGASGAASAADKSEETTSKTSDKAVSTTAQGAGQAATTSSDKPAATYSRTERANAGKTLPSTGEGVSLVTLFGAGLSVLGFTVFKRRK